MNRKSDQRNGSAANGGIPPSEQAIVELRNSLGNDVLDRLKATGCTADDAFLAKWLHARGPAQAPDCILAHLLWREEFVGQNPLGICETSITEELAAKKIFLQGLDHHGCAVLLFLVSRHAANSHNGDLTLRLLAYAIDAACTAADITRNSTRMVTCVFDLSGVKLKNVNVHFLLGLFDLLQKHYPQTLSRLYFIDAPFIFFGVWRCVAPFISPNTRAKITFIAGMGGRRQLADAIGASILPQRLGGTSELVPVDDSVAILRAGGKLASAAGEESVFTQEESSGIGGALQWSLDRVAAAGRGARSIVVYPFRKFLRVVASGGDGRAFLIFMIFIFFLIQVVLLLSSIYT